MSKVILYFLKKKINFDLKFYLKLDYLADIKSEKFYYAENIERTLDNNSPLSFSKIRDAIRSTSSEKYEMDVFNEQNKKVGIKKKKYHVPGKNYFYKIII